MKNYLESKKNFRKKKMKNYLEPKKFRNFFTPFAIPSKREK